MDETLKQFEEKSRSVFESLRRELSGIRANRPAAGLVEHIQAEYGGAVLTLKQLASISVVPPREIQLSVWDKGAVASVLKALEGSSLGLRPTVQGQLIRLPLPPLTEERRAELMKLAKSTVEKSRIQLRHFRDDANKRVDAAAKAKEINEDQKFKLKERIQKAVDAGNKDIEQLLAQKVAEVSE